MGKDITKADVVMVVFEPAALGEVDGDGGESIRLGDVVDQVEC